MGNSFNIKTGIFEGPLELLLSLIEKRKLFINDISLSQVADDYIEHVKSLNKNRNSALNTQGGVSGDQKQEFVSDLAQFILVASTLVLIKSKSLLPDLSLSEEEQGSIEDLENRLKEYQKYKALSKHLSERFGINTEYFKLPSKDKPIVFSPSKNLSSELFNEIIKQVLLSIPQKEFIPKTVVQKVISLEEMMDDLSERISRSVKLSFKEYSKHGKNDRINVIISFLAMLELVKQGIISVRQDRHFHDIEIEGQSVGVPRL
jgi:segregation and condensation protein A